MAAYVPTYEYVLSYDNSFGYLNINPIPRKWTFLSYFLRWKITWAITEYGFDLGVTHGDELQLLSKLQEDSAFDIA